jgi:two-component system chemotaxis sensor kinase CheA
VVSEELSEELTAFVLESLESLEVVEADLLRLEQDPADDALLGGIFRAIHSIKGGCGFFDFGRLRALAHACESLLAMARDHELVLDAPRIDLVLAVVDRITSMLVAIGSSGAEPEEDPAALIARLEQAATLAEAPAAPGDDPRPSEVRVGENAIVFAPVARQPAKVEPPQPQVLLDQTIRIELGQLDELVNLVGELVLARNQLLMVSERLADPDLAVVASHLSMVTAELQERVLRARMQPIEMLFAKHARLARDLARELGKEVRLEVVGESTELDRGLIDAIRDPLVHLVRNAIDHGLELPAERLARGKPRVGRLRLEARHEGAYVTIEVSDDGAGIDPAAVRERALELNLLAAEDLQGMDERALLELVFLPGFSTTATPTVVSGRGVGMDVVRANMERIGGAITLESHVGQGTTVMLRIPLTLAIIPALLVKVAGETLALPQRTVAELVRLERELLADLLVQVGDGLLLRSHQALVPIVDLASELGLREPLEVRAAEALTLVVVVVGGRELALVVDRVLDTQEIVVKPVDPIIGERELFGGATILGDGRVALILEPQTLTERLGHQVAPNVEEHVGSQAPEELVLVVRAGLDRLVAIPLYEIERIEEVARSAVEQVGTEEMLQYRGSIMPLRDLGAMLGAKPAPSGPLVRFLVPTAGIGEWGAVIEEVVDLTAVPSVQSPTVVVGGRIVEVLSLAGVGIPEVAHG